MMVYFAQIETGGPIKIGCAYWPPARLREIEGRPRILLATTPGYTSLERRFHAAFEPHHIGREWFQPVPEIMAAVDELNAASFDFDKLPKPGWPVTLPYQTKASIDHWGLLRPYVKPRTRWDPVRAIAVQERAA